VGCDAVRWQAAPTQWADAHQEEQRAHLAVARFNRLRSVLTHWVKAGGQRIRNRHATSAAMECGELLNLASIPHLHAPNHWAGLLLLDKYHF